MKTNKIQVVVPTDFLGNYVVVNDIALLGDDAFVSIDVFQGKGNAEETFATSLKLGEKLIKVNLKTHEVQTIIDCTKEQMHISDVQSVKDSILYLVEPLPSSKEKTLYIYKDNTSEKISSKIVQLIDSFRGIKDENAIIFVINSKDTYAYLSDLNAYNYISINNNTVGASVGSKNYFVSEESEDYSSSPYPMATNFSSKIYVCNRITSKVRIIRLDYYPFNISIYGDEICFVNHNEDKDSVIYINLKDNGF